jgi:hypothetical protein
MERIVELVFRVCCYLFAHSLFCGHDHAKSPTQRVQQPHEQYRSPAGEDGRATRGRLPDHSGPALVHFADGQTQQWLMVHLEDPDVKQ